MARGSKTRYAHLNANWLEMNNRLSKGDLVSANINNYVNQIDLFCWLYSTTLNAKCCWWWQFPGWRHRYFLRWSFYFGRIRHQVAAPLNQLVTASQRLNTAVRLAAGYQPAE